MRSPTLARVIWPPRFRPAPAGRCTISSRTMRRSVVDRHHRPRSPARPFRADIHRTTRRRRDQLVPLDRRAPGHHASVCAPRGERLGSHQPTNRRSMGPTPGLRNLRPPLGRTKRDRRRHADRARRLLHQRDPRAPPARPDHKLRSLTTPGHARNSRNRLRQHLDDDVHHRSHHQRA